MDNPNYKKLVCNYLTYEDIYDIIGPVTYEINLVWRDIMEYRLRNGYIQKAFNGYRYHKCLESVFNIIGKSDRTVKLFVYFVEY